MMDIRELFQSKFRKIFRNSGIFNQSIEMVIVKHKDND